MARKQYRIPFEDKLRCIKWLENNAATLKATRPRYSKLTKTLAKELDLPRLPQISMATIKDLVRLAGLSWTPPIASRNQGGATDRNTGTRERLLLLTKLVVALYAALKQPLPLWWTGFGKSEPENTAPQEPVVDEKEDEDEDDEFDQGGEQ